MTVITVVAIGAIGALFYAFVWPMIQRAIVNNTCSAFGKNKSGKNYIAVRGTAGGSGNEKTNTWYCCPDGTTKYDATVCIVAK
jgi:hypothetical protein